MPKYDNKTSNLSKLEMLIAFHQPVLLHVVLWYVISGCATRW